MKKVFNKIFVVPIISTIPEDGLGVRVVFLILLVSSLSFGLNKIIWKQLYPTISSIISCATITIIYLVFFRFDSTYIFFNFSGRTLINFADIFLISSLIFITSYKSYKKKLEKESSVLSFLDDSPKMYTADVYNRQSYAQTIVNHINATSCNNSFAIAIAGEWGSGKTNFMIRIQEELKLNVAENIVFDFNPWRVNKVDAIVEEFFKTLSSKLKPYNNSIVPKIKEYSNKVLQTSKEVHFKFLDTLINDWVHNEDIEKQYALINQAIKSTGKRLIIFVDDLDRLNGKEIMEVLRVIRSTANFANTFFIVTTDMKYITDALGKTNSFSNETEYLKKIFQLTITLPTFKKEIYKQLLEDFLLTEDLNEKEKKGIANGLKMFSEEKVFVGLDFFNGDVIPQSNFNYLIDNIRTLKTFCNSFKIAYNILKGEVDVNDLMVLELIRTRNIEVYNLLRNKTILTATKYGSEFSVNEESWKAFAENKEQTILSDLKLAIDYLFTDSESKSPRKILRSHNSYLYFSYHLGNLISLLEFNKLIEQEEERIISKFQEWIAEKKEEELLSLLNDAEAFFDNAVFKKMAPIYLKIIGANKNVWLNKAENLIFRNRSENYNKYFEKNDSLYKDFLTTLVNDESISPFHRALVAKNFSTEYIRHFKGSDFEKELGLRKKEWQEVIYILFIQYLETKPISFHEIMDFYICNWSDKDANERFVIYEKTRESLKKYLSENIPVFSSFFQNVVQLDPRSFNDDIFQLAWWLKSIFNNAEEFKEKVHLLKIEDGNMKMIKEIIITNIEAYYENEENRFKISDEKERNTVLELIKRNKENK